MSLKRHTIPVTPLQQNCTLLWDDESKEVVITDLGGELQYFLNFINQHRLILKAVWLTHGHFDHIQEVSELLNQQAVPVLGPAKEDAHLLTELPQILIAFGFPPKAPFIPTRWLNEGEILTVGSYHFKVLHIPGHSPGHVVFYCKAEKLLIAGDVLFLESIGRTDFPDSNHRDFMHAIKNKILPLPDDTLVITGHGAFTTIGHERKFNPFLQGLDKQCDCVVSE